MDYGSPEIIITVLIAFAIGLAAGYLIWGYADRETGAGGDAARPQPPAGAAAPSAPAASGGEPSAPPGAGRDTAAEPPAAAPAAEGASGPPPGLHLDGPPERTDDLKRIKGVGPKLEQALHAAGIYRYAQIARLSAAEQRWLGETLGTFPDRIARDDWPGQAAALHREVHGGDPV